MKNSRGAWNSLKANSRLPLFLLPVRRAQTGGQMPPHDLRSSWEDGTTTKAGKIPSASSSNIWQTSNVTWTSTMPSCLASDEGLQSSRSKLADTKMFPTSDVEYEKLSNESERPRSSRAAMSESPERRRRAQFAGKVKGLVLQEAGDKSQLEVEFGTGNVWYGRVRVASAVLTAPEEADKAGVGWISLPTLARQMGTSLSSLTTKWNELKQVIVDEGKLNFEKGNLQMIAGRSDHEPILVPLRGPAIVAETIANFRPGNSDPIALVAEIARQITIPGKQIDVFRESKEIKQFRRRVLEMEPGTDRKQLWKQLAKQRRDEHRAWQNQKLAQAGKKHWQDKQAVDNEKHSQAWELRLRSDDRWRETLTKHFGRIFHKSDSAVVDLHFAVILHRMAGQCKLVRWRPFTEEDLKAVRKRWKNGKACGPDSVSHEALKVLEQDDHWRGILLHVFNDMLYTAKIPASIENGVTVLLAKTPSPGDWSDTRPITLSSTLLRSFSQLIIGRASHCVQGDSRLQWARKRRQGVELILVIRRLCRVAHDWGLPMYLAKLDIRKAFDSIYQEALAEEHPGGHAMGGTCMGGLITRQRD
ncbi:pol [Symbiodinium necroappetens]|uniref:Pol protein n=1 Tax=Symbiodinium necroappetens TaxID=1628268 RepID=A0A812TA36_9DINO|nr:pol [Symbiodinium necroappetens]